jgi:hypothetical protein
VLSCVCVEDLLQLCFLMYGKDLLLALLFIFWNEVLVKLGCIVNPCFVANQSLSACHYCFNYMFS